MLSWLYRALGTLLNWFSIGGHYAIGLLFYALAAKLIFLPFSIKQQKNQIAMANLRPKIAQIEKKYAGRNDQPTLRKKQQEIMELQQKEGYSPLSGCLPMLIQFPLIIWLYNVIRHPLLYIVKVSEDVINAVAGIVGLEGKAIENEIGLINKINSYVAEHGSAAIAEAGLDVSQIPNFNLFGLNLADTPWNAMRSGGVMILLVLIPVLAAALQWLTMFLTRKWSGNAQSAGTDQQTQMSMRMMDIMFPALTLWMAFSFSGMLGLYWIYQSAFAILQSFILSVTMPLPTFTPEQLREMEKAEKERAKIQRQMMKEQPRHKSLHYIDEDDYDDLPETKKNTGGNKASFIDAPEIQRDDRNKK